MIKTSLTLINKLGLHARASAKLVSIASRFSSKIRICKRDKLINAKNILKVMLLDAAQYETLHFTFDGQDEHEASQAIEKLIQNRFDEPN